MKTLYFECSMGAAGDMLTAALLDLLSEKEQIEIIDKLNSLGLPNVRVSLSTTSKCGINGKHVDVRIHGESEESLDCDLKGEHHHEHSHGHSHHHHSSLHDIEHIINDLPVSDKVKKDALNVYALIAEAESHAHGKPISDIHFHEVGTLDAVVDVVAVCLLVEKISPDRIVASPVHVGSGHVHCAHGILPVPAPATAFILKGVPTYGGKINGELCTPTGAALLKYFASEFGDMPVMSTDSIGYGMGNKDFEVANCLRVMLGADIGNYQHENNNIHRRDSEDVFANGNAGFRKESVNELVCNIDDMTAEEVGFAIDILMGNGALEVYTVPTTTKKSRPGYLLTVLCKDDNKAEMIKLIMKHTSTIGIRQRVCDRYALDRSNEIVKTEFGDVHKKISNGFGITKEKYEHDDLARIAKENDLSIAEVIRRIEK